MRDLSVLIDDNGSFIDESQNARDFLRDPIALNIVAAEDFIYVGLYKKFNSIYAEVNDSTAASSISFEFSNGSGFSALDVRDDTKAFSRSGFVKWERDQESWIEQNVNGETLFWIRLSFGADFTANLSGLNLVFSDDNDLRQVQRDIDDFKFKGDASFIAYHVGAREEIIQSLRNSGYTTRLNSNPKEDLTQWDILNIEQINNAAKYLTLSNIMFDVSTNEDDKYYQKWRDYKGMFGESFKLYLLWLDTNNNGKLDEQEQNFNRNTRLFKV